MTSLDIFLIAIKTRRLERNNKHKHIFEHNLVSAHISSNSQQLLEYYYYVGQVYIKIRACLLINVINYGQINLTN